MKTVSSKTTADIWTEEDDENFAAASEIITKSKGKGGHTFVPVGPRCYESHPALDLGDGFVVYGGACGHPVVNDADIYIALQSGNYAGKACYPWDPQVSQEIVYPITDFCAPDHPGSFKKMIKWLAVQIRAGKKVHVGCIGGHGRTGTVFAALVKEMTGNEDAITYVREHYCKKAVESGEQINFLHQHFGIKKVKVSKTLALGPLGGAWAGYKSNTPVQFKGKRRFEAVQSDRDVFSH